MNLQKTLLAAFAAGILTIGAGHAQEPKPAVVVYATGGTIAGASKSNTDTTTYKAASLGVQALLEAVPELAQVAKVSGEQIANVGSNAIDQAILLRLAHAINIRLAEPSVHGAVVTHGTDTLEETAFFLDLTTASPKPVVVVGSMRPATAISADGPMNLLQAVTLAASKDAENRGVLIALNDRIGSAYYTTKTNTTAVDTFRATEQGYLGMFIGTVPKFYYSAATPVHKPHFNVQGVKSFPKVSIVYMHEDQDNEQIEAAIRAGAKGIVIAGTGNGSVPPDVKKKILELTEQGFPVVRSTRTGSGFATKKEEGIGSGALNPQKSRILLMLALAQSSDLPTIRRYFEE
ncbi:asparaginase [Cupriavidus necator]|uniref:asparaginase n=1 Tax=Cupriavidus necator TaxID=106590 RepID=UPI0027847401|nr:asparaginase [Cupriavidus necator]MDQ0140718.1 L-asparaginase [Cupriavidus necator]